MIPKSMSKFAIKTEIEYDILGKIHAFSRLSIVRMMHFDLLETI